MLEELVTTQWKVYKCSPLWNVEWKKSDRVRREAQEGDGDMTINVMRMLGKLSKYILFKLETILCLQIFSQNQLLFQ